MIDIAGILIQPTEVSDTFYLIIFRDAFVGVLTKAIIDTGLFSVKLSQHKLQNDTVQGTTILNDRLTLLFNVEKIINCAQQGQGGAGTQISLESIKDENVVEAVNE